MRRSAIGLLLALVWAAGPAASETYFSDRTFSVSGDGPRESRSCKVVLVPTAILGGDSAPRLAIQTHGPGPVLVSVGLDKAEAFDEPVLVRNNQRLPVVPLLRVRLASFRASDLFAALGSKAVFFVTAGRGGAFVSSRYENVDLDRILAKVEELCPFSAEELMADLGDRAVAEDEMGLDAAEILHIRWVLNRKYGDAEREPAAGPRLLADERNYVKSYTAERGLPASQFLTPEAARMLLGESFEPRDIGFASRDDYERFGRWYAFTAHEKKVKVCSMATRLASSSEVSYWRVPYMYLEIRTSERGKGIRFDLASPNPFDPAREVWALVDGQRFPLQLLDGRVSPAYRRGNKGDLSNAMIRLLPGAGTVTIAGTSRASGNPLALEFAGGGFGQAFKQMLIACRKFPSLLSWLR